MFVILPVEAVFSEDPATMASIEVRRVMIQIEVTEAEALRGGDPVAESDLTSVVRSALVDLDGPA